MERGQTLQPPVFETEFLRSALARPQEDLWALTLLLRGSLGQEAALEPIQQALAAVRKARMGLATG